ncbi:hypothetical protein CFP56_037561 [Quercus suber]|uniref:RNase H type-1 domain-containing protein n=1 Tax=Quercus suber TaxID=58331 RepID=A0AAW0J4F3_QUESU
MGSNMDIPDLAIKILHQGTQRDLEKFFRVAWRMWYNRNQVLYEANGTSEAHIWGGAICMIKDFKEANGLKIKHIMDKKDHWEPPPVGFYTINVDGAIPLANGHSGIGVIVRDSDSRFVVAMSLPLQGRYSVEETEATVVEQRSNDVRGDVGHIVKGIVQSLCNFQEHINRTSNKIAHELARHARRIREIIMWRVEIPEFLFEIARSEGAS